MTAPENIDAYIAQFEPATAAKLDEMRAAIRRAAPEATETISYAIPAFKLAGMLVWFAAHKRHIGFYPRGSGIARFANELAGY